MSRIRLRIKGWSDNDDCVSCCLATSRGEVLGRLLFAPPGAAEAGASFEIRTRLLLSEELSVAYPDGMVVAYIDLGVGLMPKGGLIINKINLQN